MAGLGLVGRSGCRGPLPGRARLASPVGAGAFWEKQAQCQPILRLAILDAQEPQEASSSVQLCQPLQGRRTLAIPVSPEEGGGWESTLSMGREGA